MQKLALAYHTEGRLATVRRALGKAVREPSNGADDPGKTNGRPRTARG